MPSKTAVVEVKFVNPPKPGQKRIPGKELQGSIRVADETGKAGPYYGVPESLLEKFQEGGIYEIEYDTRTAINGRIFHSITKPPVAHASKTAPAAAKVLGDVQRARTNEADANRMWVCALLGHSIQAGLVDIWTVTSMAQAGRNFLEAHKIIFSDEEIPEEKANGPLAKQQLNEEMEDDIPY